MFYDTHFIIDITNWDRGVWVDGTVQIMDREDILLSDHVPPSYVLEFPDKNYSAHETLACMVNVAKIYDRILVLAEEHGVHIDKGESPELTVSSGGVPIGTMAVFAWPAGPELHVGPFSGEDASKKLIWDRFVNDVTRDPAIVCAHIPVRDVLGWNPPKPFIHSLRFHVYTMPLGERTFVSGEVALTDDTTEFLRLETDIGVVRTDTIVDSVQEMLDCLVVGASVMDRLALVADVRGITLKTVRNSLIVAYFGDETIGQITVYAGKSNIEFSLGSLDSPGRPTIEARAWSDFCTRVREIPNSRIV